MLTLLPPVFPTGTTPTAEPKMPRKTRTTCPKAAKGRLLRNSTLSISQCDRAWGKTKFWPRMWARYKWAKPLSSSSLAMDAFANAISSSKAMRRIGFMGHFPLRLSKLISRSDHLTPFSTLVDDNSNHAFFSKLGYTQMRIKNRSRLPYLT